MAKSASRPKANGAREAFANSQSPNGKREGIPRNGNGRRESANPKGLVVCATDSHEHEQTQALDLFGPIQEWSMAAEYWSLPQWQAINAILFNGNTDPHEFLLCHESPNAKERFNKAKRADLSYHVEQSYQTVTGEAKRPCGIGYYPWNGDARQQSYWGALDFDAHEGQSPKRARQLAARLVKRLQASPTLTVIACTSGASGGWHVFMFRNLPRPIAEWSAFLRKLCGEIGARVGTPADGGDCELHPIETDERPRGIRAPGSLNPKDGSFGLIAFDSLTPRLRRRDWQELLPAKLEAASRRGSAPKATIILLGNTGVDAACSRYAIKAPRTRRKRLIQMVGFMVNQFGHGLALKAAAQQYRQAQPPAKSPMDEHLADFGKAWQDFTKKRFAKFNSVERREYRACKTDTERSAFLIIRNWLKPDGGGFVHRNTLAAYLEVSSMRASRIRRRFCERGIMRMTEDYIPHQRARRYQWLLDDARQSNSGAKP